MKIRMTKSYKVYQVYDIIEINKEDYSELDGLTDEEDLTYLNENIYDFEVKGSNESSLVDEFEFNRQVLREDYLDEEHSLILVGG